MLRLRRSLALPLVLGMAALLPIPSASRIAEADPPPVSQPNTALNALWNTYGNQGGHWTGGDSTVSVPLPDGRTAWLFSDTYLGAVNPDHTRPASAPMVHNSMVVEQNGQLTQTLAGGTATAPRSLVEVAGSELQYWVADGTVEGNTLRVLFNQYEMTGTGSLDVALRGTALASFSLPGLTLTGVQTLPLGSTIAWGNAIMEDGGYTYLYGSEHTADGIVFLHVARVPAGGLSGAWQFWNGSTWSATEADSVRLVSGVGTAFSVTRVGGQYVLVTQDSNLLFSPLMVAYTAAAPTGPFGSQTVLFQAAEWGTPDRPIIVYDARVHQQFNTTGTLVLSYNVNSLDPQDNLDDVTIYRPRFMNVPWPPTPPAPSDVPAPPTGLTVRSDDDGVAQLNWTAPPGSGLTYHLYQRDLTAGQSYPSRVPTSYSATTADAALLKDGHTYEFRVTARNAAGEGQQSAPVTMTAHVTPPAAPGNLRATPDGDGQIRLAWDAVPGTGVIYTVYQRDTTAGEPEFVRLSIPDPATTSTTLGYLRHNHSYEFKVTAKNGGGESGFSAVVTATARWATPAAPTGLVATPKPDGDITLSWTAPGPNLWYWVYQRDVTAGETEFTKLIYPVLETTFTAGLLAQDHRYEFKVASTNQGGDSPTTAAVAVTAHATTPPVPVGLTAEPLPDGTIRLSWTAPGPNLWYWVYQRDVTAGEAEFTKLLYPVADGTAFTAGFLVQDHSYEFKVASTNKGGDSPPTAAVLATAHYQLPSAPTGLTATAQSDGSVALSWTAPGSGLWYWVYLRDVTAGETEFTKLIYPVTTGTTHTASGLTHAHLYEFKISAINAAGEGPGSAVVSAVPNYPLPAAPTNLTATPGDGQVSLSWTAPPGDVWYWAYYRDVTAGQTDFTRAAYPVAGQTTVTLGYLVNGDTYEFKVTAINQAGEGEPSNLVQARPVPPRPGKPTGLTATPGTDGSVALAWSAPGPNLYYWIYQRDVTAGQQFQKLLYPTANTSFVATGLTNNHVYEFKVAGTNLAGDGPDSDPASATVHYDPPPAPTNLRGTSSGDGTVALDWDAPGPNLYYWVYLRDVTAGQTAFTKATYPTAETQASWGFLADGHTYEFRVTAENAGGEGQPSNTVQVVAHATLPAAPTNLRGTPGDGQVRLDWTASSTPGVWYWIYQRDVTTGQSWQRLQYPLDPSTGGTTFTATWLTNGHTYQFKVAATNSAGDSPPSNVVSVTPVQPRPVPPTNLAATPQPNQVLLTWTASATPGVWYWVEYRDATIGQGWQRLPLPLGGGTSFTFTGLSAHDYQFRLRSTNAGGDSDPSNVATARPLPPLAPSGLTATAGVAQVELRWNASATPNVWYWVEYRDASIGQAWQRMRYPVAGGTSFTMTGLKGHVYEFRVRSTAMSGDSVPSNVVSAVPLPPLPPTNLTATPQPLKILLRWNASPTPNVWYWVEYRSAFGGPWTRLAYPVAGATSFTMTGLPEMPYQFRIRSVGVSGDSVPSNVVTATPLPPLPPSNLTAVGGDMQATLNWSPSPTPNVWYWPEYRNASRNGSWVQAAYPIPGTTWTPGFLANGDVYEFRVRATTAYSMSVYSNIAAARPFPPVPAAPGWLSAWTSSAYYSVELSWYASPTPRVGYWVYYRLAGDYIWTRTTYPTFGTSITMCCHPGGEVSEFAVAATNMAGEGPWSNVTTAYSRPRTGGFGWRFGNQINGSNRWAPRLTAGPCESGDHQMICYNSLSAIFERPMTVGDYLLWPYSKAALDSRLLCESYKRANIRAQYGRSVADNRGPLLLAHEARHSTQWSWHLDYRTFLAAYAANSRWFEEGANLWWGGYNIQPSGSPFGRGGGNCGWLY